MMNTGNVILDYAENRGAEREREETARRMLDMGMDLLDIIKATNISADRLREIRENIPQKSAFA